MKDIDDFLIDKVTQLLQMDEFSQAVARLGSSAQYLIGLSYEREKLKGLFPYLSIYKQLQQQQQQQIYKCHLF